MRWMQLWLYLLGAVTALVIALRRVLRRQAPLSDELYSKQVAIDHVHSGVAWVRADGTLGSLNPALARSLRALPAELVGRAWETLFPESERPRIQEAYGQALLLGRVSLDTTALRVDGSAAYGNLTLVTIHDHKARFVGHYCLIEDRTHEIELEEQVSKLTSALNTASLETADRAV
jgi:PAS domain S-box-containing protein